MYNNAQTNRIIECIKAEYGAELEFLWPERYPVCAIFRHGDNRKWFALIGAIRSKSLGLEEDREIEIINLKFDKGQALDFAESSEHIYPAYHMNKYNWITITLDDSLADNAIFELVKKSYLLTAK